MNNLDRQYFELLNHILENGHTKGDRTGTGTKSIFDYKSDIECLKDSQY